MVISRLMYRKGIDLLVGVIPHVCRDLENVDFIVGGDGNKLLNLKEMVERERIQERVEFLVSCICSSNLFPVPFLTAN